MFKFLFFILAILFAYPASAETLRVAVLMNQSTAELSCSTEFAVVHEAGVEQLPKGRYFLKVEEGALKLEGGATLVGEAVLRPLEGKALPQVNKRSYKGELRARVVDGKLQVINNVDVEDYLASVLPAKTMVVWPDEAIKAQAVAARSYALHAKYMARGQAYDLTSLDVELPYQGTDRRIEKAAVTKLIAKTKGQYLADSRGVPIMAVTTASTGGKTESGAYSYLQSVGDDSSDSPDYKWEQVVTPVLWEGMLAQRGYALGKLTSIRLSPLTEPGADRSATGRVRYVILTGKLDSAQVAASELMEMLGLKSTLFDIETGVPVPDKLKVPIENQYGMEIGSKDIDINLSGTENVNWQNMLKSYHFLAGNKEEKIIFRGSGAGTGMGLSAWGARALANAGEQNTYAVILAHYYPGTDLVK